MSVHSYFYHHKKYFYFRCLIDGKQYSRRFDEAGNRFSVEKDAFVSECIFIQEHKNIDKTVNDYFPRFYEDFFHLIFIFSRLHRYFLIMVGTEGNPPFLLLMKSSLN